MYLHRAKNIDMPPTVDNAFNICNLYPAYTAVSTN